MKRPCLPHLLREGKKLRECRKIQFKQLPEERVSLIFNKARRLFHEGPLFTAQQSFHGRPPFRAKSVPFRRARIESHRKIKDTSNFPLRRNGSSCHRHKGSAA